MTIFRRFIGLVSLILGIGSLWIVIYFSQTADSSRSEISFLTRVVALLVLIWMILSGINKVAMIANNQDYQVSNAAVAAYIPLLILFIIGFIFPQNNGESSSVPLHPFEEIAVRIITWGWPFVDMFEAVYQAGRRRKIFA